MAQSEARTELESVRTYVDRNRTLAALDNLPPLSTITIAKQKQFPSEHPYKVLLGTLGGKQLWFVLTKTAPRSHGPSSRLCVDDTDASLKFVMHDKVEPENLVQPFRRLWKKASVCASAESTWRDKMRGMLKSLAYWYMLSEVVRRAEAGDMGGGMLFVPTVIRKYLIDALKKVGTKTYRRVEDTVSGGLASTSTGTISGVCGVLLRTTSGTNSLDMSLLERTSSETARLERNNKLLQSRKAELRIIDQAKRQQAEAEHDDLLLIEENKIWRLKEHTFNKEHTLLKRYFRELEVQERDLERGGSTAKQARTAQFPQVKKLRSGTHKTGALELNPSSVSLEGKPYPPKVHKSLGTGRVAVEHQRDHPGATTRSGGLNGEGVKDRSVDRTRIRPSVFATRDEREKEDIRPTTLGTLTKRENLTPPLRLNSPTLRTHLHPQRDTPNDEDLITNVRVMFADEAALEAELKEVEKKAVGIERQKATIRRKISEQKARIGRALSGANGRDVVI